MKKIVVGIFTFLIATCVVLGGELSKKQASASTQIVNEYSDEFLGNGFSEEWETHGAEFNTEYHALSMKNFNLWGPSVNLVEHKVKKGDSIVFDLNFMQGHWLGLVFGLQANVTRFAFGQAALICTPTYTQLMERSGTQLSNSTTSGNAELPSIFAGLNITTTVRIDIAENGDIVISSCEKGGQLQKIGVYESKFHEGYIGFGGMGNTTVDFTYFKLENAEGVVYEEDFTDCALGYPTTGATEKDWVVSSTYGESNVTVGAINSVEVHETDFLSFKKPVIENGKSETVFKIAFDIKKLQLNEGAYFGVGFGRKASGDALEKNSFIGLGKRKDYYYFVNVQQGNITEIKGNFSEKLFEKNGEEQHILLTGYYGGKITVSCAGEELNFYGALLQGYMAIGCYANGSARATAWFDNFNIDKATYYNLSDEDISNDFKGIKLFEENGFEFKEKYLNKYEYYLGSGVSLPSYSDEVAKNYIQFINCNANSVLIPKREYGDFILRFDFCVTRKYIEGTGDSKGTPLNARIGFTMGLKSVYYQPTQGAFFAFQNAEILNEKQTKAVGRNMTDMQGKTTEYQDCEYNIWEKPMEWYNFMAVVENGDVKIFYKLASEPESKMEILRHEFYSESTSGYIGIFGVDGAYFQMSNLSITNLNPNSVNKTTDFEKTENAVDEKGVISMARGSTITSKEMLDNFISIIKLKTDNEATLKISFCGNSISIPKNGELICSENIKINVNSFDYKMLKNGGVMRLEVIGNSFKIGVKYNGSEAQLYTPIIEGEFIQKTAGESFALTAENGSIQISGAETFTLKSSIPCQTQNYDEAYENTFIKKVIKPEIGETGAETGGCASSVNASAFVWICIIGVVLSMMLKRRKA